MTDSATDPSARPAVPQRWRIFSAAQAKKATALFDQQLWCWGRDVKNPAGNVLLRLGMGHYRPAEERRASPRYTAAVEGGGTVTLWGFGCFFGIPNVGGIFVRRYGFVPLYTPLPAVSPTACALEELPSLDAARGSEQWRRVRLLMQGLLAWIAAYEHGIAETYGIAYREQCLADRQSDPAVPARDMAAAWERLAKRCRRIEARRATAGAWSNLLGQLHAQAMGTSLHTHSMVNPHEYLDPSRRRRPAEVAPRPARHRAVRLSRRRQDDGTQSHSP